jgi:insulysin
MKHNMDAKIDEETENLKNTEHTDEQKIQNIPITQKLSKPQNQNSSNKLSYFVYFILLTLIIGIIILAITLLIDKNVFSSNSSFFRSDSSIFKPKSDLKKYRTFGLKNGLDVVIISDPLTTTSGASLSVRVGANSDPVHLPGLAHFCEHMLFLGSKKYPNGDDYFKTVTENNGHFNAYTDRELTNYFFDIHYFAFDKALDIFSRFFIDPLFSEEKMNKEVNSVNSEFEKNLIIDTRKRSQVFTYLTDKENPFHRFTTGNIETLMNSSKRLGVSLRDELKKFHRNFYVADKMKLVIYTNEEVEDMEDIVVEKFSEIKSSSGYINRERSIKAEKNKNSFNMRINEFSTNSIETKLLYPNTIPLTLSTFTNPINPDKFGTFIFFNSLTLDHELQIVFLQKPLSNYFNFYHNPLFYFEYLLDSKEENSLIDQLKHENLANKLSTSSDREYKEFSDLVLTINLTKQGVGKVQKVLSIVRSYLDYMKSNLISERYYNYLRKVSKLNFEFKTTHESLIYQHVSELGARAHKFPLRFLLDDKHMVFNYNQTVLVEYAKGIDLEKSLIFFPTKNLQEIDIEDEFSFLDKKSKKSEYEPWYRTNFTYYKINFSKIEKFEKIENFDKNNFSQIKLNDENLITNLIKSNSNFTCNSTCIDSLRTFSLSEPSLLNKTNQFEFWFKNENEKTLDFKKTLIEVLFKYDQSQNNPDNSEDRIYILLLETYLKRKLKKLNSKLKFLSNSITLSTNHNGLKITYSSFTENIKQITKELVEKIHIIQGKETIKNFDSITQELKDHLLKEYNAQPWALSYEYLKKHILVDYTTSEEYLRLLTKITLDDFLFFMNNKFHQKYYTKLLVIGDLSEMEGREVFNEFEPILKVDQIRDEKVFKFSIKEKRKNRRIVFKTMTGNFLLRKENHQETNKNNVLLKCFKIGRHDYKNEINVKLFSSIIGNIVFRELRINKQFGYVAKSRIEHIDNFLVRI